MCALRSTATAELLSHLKDPLWRLNHLYWIQDKDGNKVKFRCNKAQEELYHHQHTFNVVLKARQMGITTEIMLFMLDACIFKSHTQAGIIAQSQQDAEYIFKRKIKFAWDNFPSVLKSRIAESSCSAREMTWANGSSIRVGTSLRSSTINWLLVTELGKTCARFPQKADEIMSGALNTVQAGNRVFIESTAEGSEGAFFNLCQDSIALAQSKRPLTSLDFKFHFIAWHKSDDYHLTTPSEVPQHLHLYFHKLEKQGIFLSQTQKWWYVKKEKTLGTAIMREFPSTPDEAFASSGEGRFYVTEFQEMRRNGQLGKVPYQRNRMVFTGWDLGVSDFNCIWFAQRNGPYIQLIDYLECNNKSLADYAAILLDKAKALGYRYEACYLPHDGANREMSHHLLWSRADQLTREFGFNAVVCPRIKRDIDGVELVRRYLPEIFIDEKMCAKGIKAVESYRKAWNKATARFEDDKPLHNEHSHGHKALETLLLGFSTRMGAAPLLTKEQIARHNTDLMIP